MHRPNSRGPRGFTLTEVMVTVGVIALLLGFLLPTLGGVVNNGRMAKAASNMRWIGTSMRMYSGDARDTILPSRFNNQDNPFPGHVRSHGSLDDEWRLRGAWADIVWTEQGLGAFPDAAITIGHDYRYDSPDEKLYDAIDDIDNPLRSPIANTIDTVRGNLATPYGIGALERADPGYFAANNFFDNDKLSAGSNGLFSNAQIRIPERSLYVVDSFAGEVIDWAHFCDVEEHT